MGQVQVVLFLVGGDKYGDYLRKTKKCEYQNCE